MQNKTRHGKWLALAGLAGLAMILTISARGQGQVSPAFEGTWRVEVVQEQGPPANALHTYSQGGAMVESNTLGPTTAHGVWQRIGPRTFATTFERFVFDPSVPFRKARIREVIEVDRDFGTFTGRAQVLLFDGNGNLIATDCARSRGTRMAVEAPACP